MPPPKLSCPQPDRCRSWQPTVSHTESAAAGFGLGRRPEVETYAFLAPDSQGPVFYFYLRAKTGRKADV